MVKQTILSLEEFFDLPQLDAGKRELLEGELLELPPSTAVHDTLSDRMCDALKECRRSAGLPRARARKVAGFVMPGKRRSWIQPDVSILQPDHPLEDGYFFGAPMLAVEVISKSNTATDIELKRRILMANGTSEFWVVYPDTRTITTQRAGEEGITRHQHFLESPLLPGFRLDLDEFFRAGYDT